MAEFADFDQRHYRTVSVTEGYRDWVPTYEDTVEDTMDLALLERIETVEWPAITRAADLGCGTGRTAAWLRAHGVDHIDGVDLTPEMLERARARGLHASLRVGDVRATGLSGGAYGLAVCSLVDEHLPDLAPLYAEAARLLDAQGVFVLVGFHPFFIMNAGVPTHFDGPHGEPIAVETHLHLFERHVGAARASGLGARELYESVIDDEWLARKPQWARYRNWPVSFAWVWARVDM